MMNFLSGDVKNFSRFARRILNKCRLGFLCIFTSATFLSACVGDKELQPFVGDLAQTSGGTVSGPLGNSALTFSPASVSFATIPVFSVSGVQAVTVTNVADQEITLGTTTGTTSAFVISASTCVAGLVLAKNATCSISLTFSPSVNSALSSVISVAYSAGASTYAGNFAVTGAGTTLVSFAGLTSLTNVTTTTMKLNWTGVAGADSYQVYRIVAGVPSLVTSQATGALCVGVVCSYVATGLTPNTANTFRVNATDTGLVRENNIVNRVATTAVSNTFSAGTLTVSEGITGTLDLDTLCTDNWSTGRVYALVSQTSTNASANCSLTANNLSCTPPYLNLSGTHQNWNESASLTCNVDGTLLSRTITIAVQGTTILPTAADSTVTVTPASVVADGVATSTVTVTLKNAANVKSPGRTVTLVSSRGATDTISAASGVSTAGGVVTFTVKSTTSGTPTFTATDTTDNITITQAPTVTFTPGAADHMVLIAGDAQSANVNASFAVDPKVQVLDRYGNVVPGVNLSFLATRGGGTVSSTKVTTDASGFASTKFYTGGSDTIQSLEVKQMGSLMPDLAGTGKAMISFAGTSTNLSAGNFNNFMPLGTNNAYNMIPGDFNADGKQDLAVAYYASGKVGVFLGNGDGTFQTRVDYVTALSPYNLVATDFNNDGKIDLAVSTYNYTSILIGNGDGTFQNKVDYAVTNCGEGIAFGDFNADGAKDLAVTNCGSNTVSILLGNKTGGFPDGTFAAKVDYATGAAPTDVVAKDLNADGKLDLVTTNNTANKISVLIGVGNGTFNAKVDYTTAASPYMLAIGDFNADSVNDIAVSTSGGGSSLSILLGNNTAGVANGTFAAKVDYANTSNSRSIFAKDLDGDGALDLITSATGYSIAVFKGNTTAGTANGTFAAHVDYIVGSVPIAMTMADFDGDGKVDAAAAGFNSYLVSAIQGLGTGAFKGFGVSSYTTGTNPRDAEAADFNGDGALDLAVTNSTTSTLSIYIANTVAGVPNGTFAAKVDYATGSAPYRLVVGDFNEDGAKDVITTDYSLGSISIFLGNKTAGVPNGTFATKVDFGVGQNPVGIAATDFNRDGHLDLVVTNYLSDNVSILFGVGNGTFTYGPVLVLPAGSLPMGVVTGDLNSDKKQDFAITANGGNKVYTFLGNGDGTFQPKNSFTTGASPYSVTLGDYNGDGKLDLVVVNYSANTISFFAGNGDGTVAAKVDYFTGANPYWIKSADFNGDGKLDVILAASGEAAVNILLGNGNGTFQTKQSFLADNTPHGVCTGDFNADGKLDFVSVNYLGAAIKVDLSK